MFRIASLFIIILLTQSCTSKIAVTTLETTIQEAATAAKEGSKGAADKIKIEVGVTNGYKAAATAPIPVVPIGIEASSAVNTKLTLEVDLTKYEPGKLAPEGTKPAEPDTYILDLSTGELTPAIK